MMRLTNEQVEMNRQRVINLLSSTKRKGMDKVLFYLDESGFFTAPCAYQKHHDWTGGLAQHALGVYDRAVYTNGGKSTPSIIICALLHDMCKGRHFFMDGSGLIRGNRFNIKGHGKRACLMLQRLGLCLTKEESNVICWHMGESYVDAIDMQTYSQVSRSPLFKCICEANSLDAEKHQSFSISA